MYGRRLVSRDVEKEHEEEAWEGKPRLSTGSTLISVPYETSPREKKKREEIIRLKESTTLFPAPIERGAPCVCVCVCVCGAYS